MAKKKKSSKSRAKVKESAKKSTKNPKYVCSDCGTEVIMDECGVGFQSLICCDKVMRKK